MQWGSKVKSTRYATLPDMNGYPGKGPGHDPTRPRPRPRREELAGSVPHPSPPTTKGFSPRGESAGFTPFTASTCRTAQPPGGKASGEQREPVCPRSVGPDRGPPDRQREESDRGRPTSCAVRTHRPAGCLVARPTPLTGTCILRRIPGSTRSKLKGRGRETCKPGVSR